MQPYFKLIGSMLLFGSIGLFVREIALPSSVIALCRAVLGGIFLLMAGLMMRVSWNWEAIRRNGLLLLFSGAAIGFNWIFLFEAYRYTTIGAATLAYYCAPLLIVLLSPFLLKEPLTSFKIGGVVLAMLGMYLVNGTMQGGTAPLVGMGYGLAAAALYASVVIMNKWIKELSALETTLIQLLAAAVVLLPYVLLIEGTAISPPSRMGLVCLLLIGIVHTGIGYTMYFGAVKKLPAQTLAVLSYIDPMSALFFAAVLLQEQMTMIQLCGAACILGGAFLSEWKHTQKWKDFIKQ